MPEQKSAIGVKASGASIDPTRNVLDLVEASVKRIDDLRDTDIKRHDDLRDVLKNAFTERIDQLRIMILDHSASDAAQFVVIQHEMQIYAQENERTHKTMLDSGAERMAATKELLTATLIGMDRAIVEAKANIDNRFLVVDSLLRQVNEISRQNVSVETFNEFRKSVDSQMAGFTTFVAQNSGERAGSKSVWGAIVAAAVSGAAAVSIITFLALPRGPQQVAPQATSVVYEKRIDDVIERMNALSARLNQLTVPLITK